ncbi:hypothetical protein B5F78_11870 [Bacteroides sp. An279]|nr:hypothetical protein B5F78_11870 [Bacteroides sp. An279]
MNFFKKFSRLDAFVFTILGDLPDVFKIPTTSVSIFAGINGINMIRICFILVFSFCILTAGGQQMSHDLSYYAEAARNYSPLLHDYRHQLQIEQAELRRLKTLYTRLRLELNGDYLFVPVLTKDGGQTSFRWNAQDATDYYGYDLGESSGPLLLVVLPALMRRIYR